jgi:ribosome recycling factor
MSIARFLVAKLIIFCETTKKNGKLFGGLTEKRYFCQQKTLKLSKIMIDVKETLKKSEERMEMAAMFLEEELNRVRAGRANVAILDGVRVELYGSKVPLNQVANVSVPDPRTIAIKPWDRKEIRNIEKAIMDSDVGITPENNGEIIRLNIPVPTEERRKDLVKQCNKIAEKAKVEVRNVRADIKDKLKKAIKDGLSEDNEKDAELELQKLHDKYIKKLDDLMAAKHKEIMTV